MFVYAQAASGNGGGDCGIGDRSGADGLPACKPSLRINFRKHHRPSGKPRLWGFPEALQGCAQPDKLVLRNEISDRNLMVRNKLSQDLYNKVGALVVRVEYARLSVNGSYFGLYTMVRCTSARHLSQIWRSRGHVAISART